MSNTVTTVLAESLSISDRLSIGVQMLLLGMGTVFAVLVILMLVLLLFKLFAYTMPNKSKDKAKENEKPVVVDNNIPENVETPAAVNNDDEIIAVITAAIEAYNSQNGNALPFRVVSFKRVKNANGWNSNVDSNNL